MSAHTPGPWAVHPTKATVDAAGLDGPVPICGLLWPTDKRSEDETAANADLIAAAPDLYYALLAIMESHGPGTLGSDDIYDEACLAIAKAEGRA